MRFRNYKKNKVSTYLSRFIIIIFLSIICSLLIINYFGKKIHSVIVPVAETKLKKIVVELINDAILEIDFNREIFTLKKDNKDKIQIVNYKTKEVQKLLVDITNNVTKKLDSLYNNSDSKLGKYIIEEIPFGMIFQNSFLNGLGPKIKIKSEMVGSIVNNIETEVKPYGINNAYIETRINIEITARIYLPFMSEEIKIKNAIPISMNVVEGNVPQGYITSYK